MGLYLFEGTLLGFGLRAHQRGKPFLRHLSNSHMMGRQATNRKSLRSQSRTLQWSDLTCWSLSEMHIGKSGHVGHGVRGAGFVPAGGRGKCTSQSSSESSLHLWYTVGLLGRTSQVCGDSQGLKVSNPEIQLRNLQAFRADTGHVHASAEEPAIQESAHRHVRFPLWLGRRRGGRRQGLHPNLDVFAGMKRNHGANPECSCWFQV